MLCPCDEYFVPQFSQNIMSWGRLHSALFIFIYRHSLVSLFSVQAWCVRDACLLAIFVENWNQITYHISFPLPSTHSHIILFREYYRHKFSHSTVVRRLDSESPQRWWQMNISLLPIWRSNDPFEYPVEFNRLSVHSERDIFAKHETIIEIINQINKINRSKCISSREKCNKILWQKPKALSSEHYYHSQPTTQSI